MSSQAESLEIIAGQLRRIADKVAPTGLQRRQIEEAVENEILMAILADLRLTRYRNMAFDGMDRIFTSVIPQRSVERALEKAFNRKSIVLPTHPAIGEKQREDLEP